MRDRYIAGMLAPRETVAIDPERQERTESTEGLSEASDDTGSDDAEGQAVPKLFPSSLG